MSIKRAALTVLGFSGGLSAFIGLLSVYYLSYINDYRLTISTNIFGEFWIEATGLVFLMGAFIWSYVGLLSRLGREGRPKRRGPDV